MSKKLSENRSPSPTESACANKYYLLDGKGRDDGGGVWERENPHIFPSDFRASDSVNLQPGMRNRSLLGIYAGASSLSISSSTCARDHKFPITLPGLNKMSRLSLDRLGARLLCTLQRRSRVRHAGGWGRGRGRKERNALG